jgi:hypothetical protein
MALSPRDRERRLHDLEVSVKALLDLLLVEATSARSLVGEAARSLAARGEGGAAKLLVAAASRSYG